MFHRFGIALLGSVALALAIGTLPAQLAQAGPGDQVEICHQAGSRTITIRVAEPAVQAHLNHGDTRGACSPTSGGGFSGVLAVNVIGGKLDLNGDGVVNGMDDSNSLFGNTNVIDGMLDCNAGAGTSGDNVINASDNCVLTHATMGSITVTSGVFVLANGPLTLDFTSPNVRWATINGLVDSDGSGSITSNDCTRGLIGLANDSGMGADAADAVNVLGSNGSIDPCRGTAFTDMTANGKVDINNSNTIDASDSCAACFFGRQVISGVVQ